MRTCKPRTIFDEVPRLISMLVACTSWLSVPHGIQHLTGRLQVYHSNILSSRSRWEHDLLQLLFEHSSLLLLCWHLSLIFCWLLIQYWSWIVREHEPCPTDLPSLLLHHIQRERTKPSRTLIEKDNNCKCWHLREGEQLQTSWLLYIVIPKYHSSFEKTSQYFVRE